MGEKAFTTHTPIYGMADTINAMGSMSSDTFFWPEYKPSGAMGPREI